MPDKSSRGFDNPNIQITSKGYEALELDADGKPVGTVIWVVGAVVTAADGTRMTSERIDDFGIEATDAELEAVIAERWGIRQN